MVQVSADVSRRFTTGVAQQRCMRQGRVAWFGASKSPVVSCLEMMACALTPLIPKELVPANKSQPLFPLLRDLDS